MTEALLAKLAEHGITGLLLVICLVVIYRLYGELTEANRTRATAVEEVQKLRIEDQRAWQAQYVELIKNCTAAVVSASAAAAATKEALGEVREAFKDLSDDLRSQRVAAGRSTEHGPERRR